MTMQVRLLNTFTRMFNENYRSLKEDNNNTKEDITYRYIPSLCYHYQVYTAFYDIKACINK